MKINDLINQLQQIRNEHGNIEVLKWDLHAMDIIDINELYYADKGNEIYKENTVTIL